MTVIEPQGRNRRENDSRIHVSVQHLTSEALPSRDFRWPARTSADHNN